MESFARDRYGSAIALAAWQAFSRWGRTAIARDQQAFQSVFSAWYLFAWLPDDSELEGQSFSAPAPDHSIAFDYLKSLPHDVGRLQRALIENASSAPYSFYVILSVESNHRLYLKDLYTERELVVEGCATSGYVEEQILFASVVQLNTVAVLIGSMPQILSANAQDAIVNHREKWVADTGKPVDRRLLYLHDTELRRFYFLLLSRQQKAGLH